MTPPTHYHHYVKVSIYPKIKNIPTKIALKNLQPGRRGHDPALQWRMEFRTLNSNLLIS